MGAKLFLDERNLQNLGLSTQNIITFRALTEFLNVQSTVVTNTTDIGTLQTDVVTAQATADAAAVAGDIASSGLTTDTAKVLGRVSASTGAIEELTITQVLDLLTGAAQGDIIYRGASAWDNLPAGTNGQFLQTQGASANPQWAGGGGAVLIQRVTTAGLQTSVSFTSIPATYTHLRIIGMGRANTGGNTAENMLIELNTDTTNAHYAAQQHQGSTSSSSAASNPGSINNYFAGIAGSSATASQAATIEALIPMYASTTFIKAWQSFSGVMSFPLLKTVAGIWNATTAISQIDLKISGGLAFVNGCVFDLIGIP